MNNKELLERARELQLEAGRERRCMGVESERRAADLEALAAQYLAQAQQTQIGGREQNTAVSTL